MTTLNNVNVVKANVKFRRWILSFLFGMTMFSWCGIYLGQALHRTAPSHPMLDLLGLGLLVIASIIAIGLFVFGLWMGRVSIASLRQRCYPPCNSMVMCDTLLVTGWRATIKALSALMLSTASILGTIGLSLEIIGLINL